MVDPGSHSPGHAGSLSTSAGRITLPTGPFTPVGNPHVSSMLPPHWANATAPARPTKQPGNVSGKSPRQAAPRTSTSADGQPDAGIPAGAAQEADEHMRPPSPAPIGGLAPDRAAALFRAYDLMGRGWLSRTQMIQALSELGAVHGLGEKGLNEVIGQDPATSREARYSLQDFLSMYERVGMYQAKQARGERIRALSSASVPPPHAATSPALRLVFNAYCHYAAGTSRMLMSQSREGGAASELRMNAAQLIRLCQDLGLLSAGGQDSTSTPLTFSVVDVVFARSKPPGAPRRLTYAQWLKALAALGDHAGCDLFALLTAHAQRMQPALGGGAVHPSEVAGMEGMLPRLQGGDGQAARGIASLQMLSPAVPAGSGKAAASGGTAVPGRLVVLERMLEEQARAAAGQSAAPAGRGGHEVGQAWPEPAAGETADAQAGASRHASPANPRPRTTGSPMRQSQTRLTRCTVVDTAGVATEVWKFAAARPEAWDEPPPWAASLLQRLQYLETREAERTEADASMRADMILRTQKWEQAERLLNSRSAALDGRLLAVERHVADSDAVTGPLKLQLEGLQDATDKAHQAAAKATAQMQHLEAAVPQAQAAADAAAVAATAADKAAQAAQAALQQQVAALRTELSSQASQLQAQVEALSSSTNQAVEAAAAAVPPQADLSSVDAQLQELNAQLDQLKGAQAAAQAQLEQLPATEAAVKEQLEQLSLWNQEARAQMEALFEAKKGTQMQLEQACAAQEAMMTQLEQLSGSTAVLQTQVGAVEEQVTAVKQAQQKLQKQQSKAQKAQQQEQEQQQQAASAADAQPSTATAAQITELQGAQEQLTSSQEGLQAQLTQLQADLGQLSSQLAAAASAAVKPEALQELSASLSSRLEEAEKRLAETAAAAAQTAAAQPAAAEGNEAAGSLTEAAIAELGLRVQGIEEQLTALGSAAEAVAAVDTQLTELSSGLSSVQAQTTSEVAKTTAEITRVDTQLTQLVTQVQQLAEAAATAAAHPASRPASPDKMSKSFVNARTTEAAQAAVAAAGSQWDAAIAELQASIQALQQASELSNAGMLQLQQAGHQGQGTMTEIASRILNLDAKVAELAAAQAQAQAQPAAATIDPQQLASLEQRLGTRVAAAEQQALAAAQQAAVAQQQASAAAASPTPDPRVGALEAQAASTQAKLSELEEGMQALAAAALAQGGSAAAAPAAPAADASTVTLLTSRLNALETEVRTARSNTPPAHGDGTLDGGDVVDSPGGGSRPGTAAVHASKRDLDTLRLKVQQMSTTLSDLQSKVAAANGAGNAQQGAAAAGALNPQQVAGQVQGLQVAQMQAMQQLQLLQGALTQLSGKVGSLEARGGGGGSSLAVEAAQDAMQSQVSLLQGALVQLNGEVNALKLAVPQLMSSIKGASGGHDAASVTSRVATGEYGPVLAALAEELQRASVRTNVIEQDVRLNLTSLAKSSDLRELENSLMARAERMEAALDDLKMRGGGGGGMGMGHGMDDYHMRMSNNTARLGGTAPAGSLGGLGGLGGGGGGGADPNAVHRFATWDALKHAEGTIVREQAQFKEESKRQREALQDVTNKFKALEQDLTGRLNMKEQVLMRMAKEVDDIKNMLASLPKHTLPGNSAPPGRGGHDAAAARGKAAPNHRYSMFDD